MFVTEDSGESPEAVLSSSVDGSVFMSSRSEMSFSIVVLLGTSGIIAAGIFSAASWASLDIWTSLLIIVSTGMLTWKFFRIHDRISTEIRESSPKDVLSFCSSSSSGVGCCSIRRS